MRRISSSEGIGGAIGACAACFLRRRGIDVVRGVLNAPATGEAPHRSPLVVRLRRSRMPADEICMPAGETHPAPAHDLRKR
jgi:hypothetical protein